MSGSDESWEVRLDGARELCDRVGLDLVAAFLKCFEGVDRVVVLEQMLVFSSRNLPEDSPSHRRNQRILVLMLGATMYELGEALQELCSAKVVEKMNDRSAWKPVNELRGRWRGDSRLAQLRNTFGFHLGHLDLYRAGLAARLAESDEQLFVRSEGTKRHDTECVLPFNALLAGAGIEDQWVKDVFTMTWNAHTELPDQLNAVSVSVKRVAA